MVPIEDLQKIYWLEKLTDEMLQKISPHARPHHFNSKDVVFEENEAADYFYMLKKGKVLLEVELTREVIISLGAVKTGFSFGWSALLPESHYTSHARCVEPCEVYSIPGQTFLDIIEKDHAMGYIVMQGLVRILENRLKRRTGQFLKVIRQHPDIIKILQA